MNFTGANLSGARLSKSELTGGKFEGANLTGADLIDAKLLFANLDGANLRGAHFGDANLASANIGKADFSEATLIRTIFGTLDFSSAIGLDQCVHLGPSVIDFATLQKSGPLPLAFLRGIGLSDTLIDYLPSLLNRPFEFYSCFISYSAKDQEFAERLHADLQNKGVRCWFAPHDLPIGAKTWDSIDEAIRLRDKVVLILSENSIASDWVEDEVSKAFAEERDRKQIILFPIRIDNAVMDTLEPWARKFRDQCNIGDFRDWKNHDSYQRSFERVLRDLKIKEQAPKS